MIVKPTVQELLEHAENRYALVIATSKRARQIAKGAEPLTTETDGSVVAIAANEIAEGKVKICKEGELEPVTETETEDAEEEQEQDNEQGEENDVEKEENDNDVEENDTNDDTTKNK